MSLSCYVLSRYTYAACDFFPPICLFASTFFLDIPRLVFVMFGIISRVRCSYLVSVLRCLLLYTVTKYGMNNIMAMMTDYIYIQLWFRINIGVFNKTREEKKKKGYYRNYVSAWPGGSLVFFRQRRNRSLFQPPPLHGTNHRTTPRRVKFPSHHAARTLLTPVTQYHHNNWD